MNKESTTRKVALITGAAQRIGAAIARALHANDMNVVLHYRSSEQEAQALCAELNAERPDSAIALQADLLDTSKLPGLVTQATKQWQQLDVLVNNASSFYPTPVREVDEAQWDDLMGTNLKAPFFLAQAAASLLEVNHGCIINITDIHARIPLSNFPVYCMAKAGLAMMTQSLAKELGPQVRVNAVAPGVIMWPKELDVPDSTKQKLLARTPLKRAGGKEEIVKAVLFLINNADFISGQAITVDGGLALDYSPN